ncbi:MAG: PilZ domain-containing protein [Candidatus Methylomirabilales bacterium]
MRLEYSPKRRYGRLTFNEPVGGDVTARHAVQVLDLGQGGARLEHTGILRPGSSCYLRLPLKQQRVTVLGRVVWSKAVELATREGGGVDLVYQSGLEFVRLAGETRARLTAFLEQEGCPLHENGGSAPRSN